MKTMFIVGLIDSSTNAKMVKLYTSHFFCDSFLPVQQNKHTNKKSLEIPQNIFFFFKHFYLEITQ